MREDTFYYLFIELFKGAISIFIAFSSACIPFMVSIPCAQYVQDHSSTTAGFFIFFVVTLAAMLVVFKVINSSSLRKFLC